MTPLDYGILIGVAITNLVAFILMGVDKLKARRGSWRIRERTLLFWCALFGGLGGWFGIQIFRHKTRHAKFTVTVPVLLLLQVALLTVYFVNWR